MKKSLIAIVGTLLLLTGCGQPKLIAPVEFSPEQIEKFQSELKEYGQKIEDAKAKGEESTSEDYMVYARAQERLGFINEAEATLIEAMASRPKNMVLRNNLGQLYESIGEYEKAAEQIEYIVRDLGLPEFNKLLAEIYLKVGNKKEGLNAYRRYVNTTGQRVDTLEAKLKALK